MNRCSHYSARFIIGLFLCGLSPALSAPAGAGLPAEAAGIIASLSGSVSVLSDAGGRHDAEAGMVLRSGDEIITSQEGWAQLMMTDRTVITLSSGSHFILEAYQFKPEVSQNGLWSEILSGSIKFISGLIASSSQGEMVIRLSQTTAAIRGTSALLSQEPDGPAELILLSGQIDLLSQTGSRLGRLSASSQGITISATGTVSDITDISEARLSSALQKTAPPQAGLSSSNVADGNQLSVPDEISEQPVFNASDELNRRLSDPLRSAYLLVHTSLTEAQLTDPENRRISIEADLFEIALSGAQPLWATRFEDGHIGNPFPDITHPSYELWQSSYQDRVSERYAGHITFRHDGFTLLPHDGYQGRATASFAAALDYDRGQLSGTFSISDIEINGISFDDVTQTALSFPTFHGPASLADIPIGEAQITSPAAPEDSPARAELRLSLGSIGDDSNIIDGRMGAFNARIIIADEAQPALSGEAISAGQ